MIENFHESPRAGLLWAARAAALVAMLVSGYLLWASIMTNDQVAGCGTGAVFDCDEVLASRWSHWLQIPISLPGIVLYGLALLCLAAVGPDTSPVNQGYAWRVLLVLAVLEVGAALWFVGLQVYMQHYCKFCLTVHACGLFLGSLILWNFPRSIADARAYRPDHVGLAPAARVGCALVGIGGLAVMFGGQMLVTPETRGAEEFDPTAQVAAATDTRPESEPATKPTDQEMALKIGEVELEDEWKNPPKEDATPPPPLLKPRRGADEEEIFEDEETPAETMDTADPVEPTKVATPDSESRPKIESKPKNTKPTRVASDDDAEPEDDPFAGLDEGSDSKPAKTIGVEPGIDERPGDIVSQPITLRQRRELSIIDNVASVDTYSDPILGPPDAESVVIKIFDYTCKHCRAEHKLLEQARKRYGDGLAIVLLPIPLNTRCNRWHTNDNIEHKDACHFARLALAVWHADPKKFPQYHRYLMESYESTSPRLAQDKAEELVGSALFRKTLADPLVEKDLANNVEIYHMLGGGPIPKLINGMRKTSGLQGEPKSQQALYDFLENTVGVRAR